MKKKLMVGFGIAFGILALLAVGSWAITQRSVQDNAQSSDFNLSHSTLTCSLETTETGVMPIQSENPCPGALTCMTYMCGGTDKNPYVCCPSGYPYLNHCDCKCYDSSDFPCGSYSYCRSW